MTAKTEMDSPAQSAGSAGPLTAPPWCCQEEVRGDKINTAELALPLQQHPWLNLYRNESVTRLICQMRFKKRDCVCCQSTLSSRRCLVQKDEHSLNPLCLQSLIFEWICKYICVSLSLYIYSADSKSACKLGRSASTSGVPSPGGTPQRHLHESHHPVLSQVPNM